MDNVILNKISELYIIKSDNNINEPIDKYLSIIEKLKVKYDIYILEYYDTVYIKSGKEIPIKILSEHFDVLTSRKESVYHTIYDKDKDIEINIEIGYVYEYTLTFKNSIYDYNKTNILNHNNVFVIGDISDISDYLVSLPKNTVKYINRVNSGYHIYLTENIEGSVFYETDSIEIEGYRNLYPADLYMIYINSVVV